MKFKLDECLNVRLATLFSDAGHDVQTVYQEKLSGAPDERVYSVCLQEERILLTQDMDFSNPLRFSPLPSQGIIVVRNPS
jgi:predicted nuclease of predicted toxin-antitoxin system